MLVSETKVLETNGLSTTEIWLGDPDEYVTVRFRDRALPMKLAMSPTLALGEAYMEGRVTIERGSIRYPLWPVKGVIAFGMALLTVQFLIDAAVAALGGALPDTDPEEIE